MPGSGRRLVFQRRGQRRWNAIFTPADCRPTPVTSWATSTPFAAAFMVLDEYVIADTTTTVFPVDGTAEILTGPPETIDQRQHGCTRMFAGVYLQDEWKMFSKVTVNYGARFDEYSFLRSTTRTSSARASTSIYQPTDSTTLHAGYARYFTPPPVENVPGGDNVAQFDGTSTTRAPVTTDRSGQGRARELFRRRHHPENHAGIASGRGRLLQDRPATSSTTDCSARHSFFRRSIMPRAGFMAWNSPAATTTAASPPTPTSPGRKAQGKDWTPRRNSCWPNQNDGELRPTITGFISTTTNGSAARSAWLTLGKKATHQHARLCGCDLRQRIADRTAAAIRCRRRSDSQRRAACPTYYTVNIGAEQSFKIRQETDVEGAARRRERHGQHL